MLKLLTTSLLLNSVYRLTCFQVRGQDAEVTFHDSRIGLAGSRLL